MSNPKTDQPEVCPYCHQSYTGSIKKHIMDWPGTIGRLPEKPHQDDEVSQPCKNSTEVDEPSITPGRFAELEARIRALEGHIHMYNGLETAEDSETTTPFVEGEDNEGQEIWKRI